MIGRDVEAPAVGVPALTTLDVRLNGSHVTGDSLVHPVNAQHSGDELCLLSLTQNLTCGKIAVATGEASKFWSCFLQQQ